MKLKPDEDAHFSTSIFYQIELTAKYCKKLGEQVFQMYNAGISIGEFAVLDTLTYNPNICQRDIAKMILRDRANTGKILDSLENKGYIKRDLKVRNNRAVKLVKLTESGTKKVTEVLDLVRPHTNLVKEKLHSKDLDKVSNMLKELRHVLDETLNLAI